MCLSGPATHRDWNLYIQKTQHLNTSEVTLNMQGSEECNEQYIGETKQVLNNKWPHTVEQILQVFYTSFVTP